MSWFPPGVLSALGGLIADIKNDFIATVFLDLEESAMPAILDTWAALEAQARKWLFEEQGYRGEHRLVYSADMRYRGQSYEIETEVEPDHVAQGDMAGIAEAFHRRHEQIYEHADRDAAVQVINLRMVIVGTSPKPDFPESQRVEATPEPARQLQVFMDGARRRVPLYVRAESLSRPPLHRPRRHRPERLHHLRARGAWRRGRRIRQPDSHPHPCDALISRRPNIPKEPAHGNR